METIRSVRTVLGIVIPPVGIISLVQDAQQIPETVISAGYQMRIQPVLPRLLTRSPLEFGNANLTVQARIRDETTCQQRQITKRRDSQLTRAVRRTLLRSKPQLYVDLLGNRCIKKLIDVKYL